MTGDIIYTERLILKPLYLEATSYIVKWRNDPAIQNHLFASDIVTEVGHIKWYNRYLKDKSRYEWVIVHKEDTIPIGTIGLSQLNQIYGTAEYGILLGENKYYHKGYAKEASLALIDYGFNQLNLKTIVLNVFSDNITAIALYETLGFKVIRTLKESALKNGIYKDVIYMELNPTK